MSHTPEQALSLWCPMVRHEGDGCSFSRGNLNSNPTNADNPEFSDKKIQEQLYGCHCIADKCAMWRWVNEGKFATAPVPDKPGLMTISYLLPEKGYCGLAGKPC